MSVGVRQRWIVAVASAAAVAVVASGCSSSHHASRRSPAGNEQPQAPASSTSAAPSSTPAAPAARLSTRPANGTHHVSPTRPITVAVADGTLTSVIMKNSQGKRVQGEVSADKHSWKVAEDLGYSKTYTIRAKAVNPDGKPVHRTTRFTTLTPDNMTLPYMQTVGQLALHDGATYGVGMVVNVHFDEPISDKAAAERTLEVKTEPEQQGGWYWLDDQNVHWRPKHYYQSGTHVTVSANVYGKRVSPGLYGQEDVSTSFKIGPKHVSIADDKTHMVKVYFNNKLVRRMPTSMGQGGYVQGTNGQISLWTMPGTYTVLNHQDPVLMDSSTFGLPVDSPKGYKEYINLATQISTDGIYLHELESTIWAQGHTDVSHGCLNLNHKNAKWFYNTSMIGDVVQVKHSGGPPLQVWQGGDWSVPWSEWVAGSALH